MRKKVELLNSEGPILTVYRIEGDEENFRLVDQYKSSYTVPKEAVYAFLKGDALFADSAGKVWNYLEESSGMKSSKDVLSEFFGDIQ